MLRGVVGALKLFGNRRCFDMACEVARSWKVCLGEGGLIVA